VVAFDENVRKVLGFVPCLIGIFSAVKVKVQFFEALKLVSPMIGIYCDVAWISLVQTGE
jgi:hypothetical protein